MAGLAFPGRVSTFQTDLPLGSFPFSPWREREALSPGEQADLDNRPPSALDDLWLSGFADLYRAFAGVLSPAEVDKCELWVLAALLGGDRVEADDPMGDLERRVEAGKASLAKRAAKLPGANPQVEGEGSVDMTAQIAASMGIKFG
jgi:hypothetical protein